MFKNKNLLILLIVANVWGIAYITWRTVYTVNYLGDIYSLSWSILLLLAEIFSMMIFISFSLAASRKEDYQLPHCPVKPIEKMPSIDIFVCSLNEEEEIVKPTLMAALNIDYPNKKVYLLDDGRRAEMFELTKKLGCNYITRQTNKGFKAGNINNALKQTNGEIVIIFDADHIPVSTFIKDIVCNFSDPDVALIQTPQHFFNLDPFQKNLGFQKYVTNEQDLFYRVIEPGLATYNATVCGGTNFFFRRQYVEKAGGFPEDTITEDFALGLKLEIMGYKILYYNKPVATGKSTETFGEYIKQRSRWARGNLSVIFNFDNFKNLLKLNFLQIFFKISGVSYFFYPFARLIFILSPAMFILFDLITVNAIIYQIATFQVFYFIFKIWFFIITSGRYRHFLFTDVYETATSPFLAKDIAEMFLIPSFIKKQKFLVTDKSDSDKPSSIDLKFFLPVFLLFLFLLFTESSAIWKINFTEADPGPLAVNIFWNTYNLIIMMYALRVVIDRKEKRESLRIPVRQEVVIINENKEKFTAHTVNISQTGALLISIQKIPEGFLTGAHIILPGCEEMGLELVEKNEQDNQNLYQVKFNSLCKDDICYWNQDVCLIDNIYKNSDEWE